MASLWRQRSPPARSTASGSRRAARRSWRRSTRLSIASTPTAPTTRSTLRAWVRPRRPADMATTGLAVAVEPPRRRMSPRRRARVARGIQYAVLLAAALALVLSTDWSRVGSSFFNPDAARPMLHTVPAALRNTLVYTAAAFVAVTLRAGLQAVHRGQVEAAWSRGMSYTRTLMTVVIP